MISSRNDNYYLAMTTMFHNIMSSVHLLAYSETKYLFSVNYFFLYPSSSSWFMVYLH